MLFSVMDIIIIVMGSCMLQWVIYLFLIDQYELYSCLDVVEIFINDDFEDICIVLKYIGDIECIMVCLVFCLVWLCDFVCLKNVFNVLFDL